MNIRIKTLTLFLYSYPCFALDSPENLFRQTVRDWRQKRSWNPWIELATTLLQRFDGTDNEDERLEIVGALEESILAIETVTVARGAGEDPQRDASLSSLYTSYGYTLMHMSADECHKLALDPHTLLIGADTIPQNDDPSSYLCIENAENALRNAATLDATNTDAENLLMKVTGTASVHERKPKEFVAELFDSFADKFDDVLIENLQYKVPQMVGETVRLLRDRYSTILDAGCGTGLAGRVIHSMVDNFMIGVDASQKMLDIAAKCTLTSGCGLKKNETIDKPLYDNLIQMDLEDMTIQNTIKSVDPLHQDGFDLIVAADVLVYFGRLESILKTFAEISVPGAVLVFSCERATEVEAPLGWRLLSSGRFSHTKKHVLQAASKAGYIMRHYDEIIPRIEKGEDVKGHIFGFILQEDTKDEF